MPAAPWLRYRPISSSGLARLFANIGVSRMLEPRTALPWQALQWERLTGLQRDGRLPHALLLSGPEGIGKLRLAQVFAAYLLCENPSISGACGDCQACHLQ